MAALVSVTNSITHMIQGRARQYFTSPSNVSSRSDDAAFVYHSTSSYLYCLPRVQCSSRGIALASLNVLLQKGRNTLYFLFSLSQTLRCLDGYPQRCFLLQSCFPAQHITPPLTPTPITPTLTILLPPPPPPPLAMHHGAVHDPKTVDNIRTKPLLGKDRFWCSNTRGRVIHSVPLAI